MKKIVFTFLYLLCSCIMVNAQEYTIADNEFKDSVGTALHFDNSKTFKLGSGGDRLKIDFSGTEPFWVELQLDGDASHILTNQDTLPQELNDPGVNLINHTTSLTIVNNSGKVVLSPKVGEIENNKFNLVGDKFTVYTYDSDLVMVNFAFEDNIKLTLTSTVPEPFFSATFEEDIKACIKSNKPVCGTDDLPVCKNPSYAVKYNVAGNTVHYFKNKNRRGKEWKTKRRIRPSVGSELYFLVKNDNPYRDTLSIHYEFISLFKEDQKAFLDLVNKFGPPQNNAVAAASEGGQFNSLDDGEVQEGAEQLLAELNAKLAFLKTLDSFDMSCLQVQCDTLHKKVVEGFGTRCLSMGWKAFGLANTYNFEGEDLEKWKETTEALDKVYSQFIPSQRNRSQSVQIKNDDITRFSLKDNQNKEIFVERDLKNSWGFKIDFSTGLIASSLNDETYSLDSTSTPGTTSIVAKDGDDWNLRFGTMAHFYPRTGSMIDVGAHFGFLVDSDLDTQLGVGASLMLGKPDRVALSVGMAFGRVDRLKTTLESQQAEFNGSPVETLTEERWDMGLYFGLTFNFAQVNGKD